MKKIKYTLFIIFLCLYHFCSFGQSILPDGVTATPSYITEIKKNYNDELEMAFDMDFITLSAKIPVRVHIIKNILGMNGVNSQDIYNSINTANTYFKNIGIQFFVDSVDYIADYNYSLITYNHNRKELLIQFAVDNRINLFLADSVKMGYFRSYGFTYFPDATDSNFIFLDKAYLSGKYLTTMLGHYMGLLSTHESAGGSELANENNCASAGDFICDTYADPGLYLQVDSACKYTGSAKDSSGKYYLPSVSNMMSDSRDQCKCIFTPLQYRRMHYYYLKRSN